MFVYHLIVVSLIHFLVVLLFLLLAKVVFLLSVYLLVSVVCGLFVFHSFHRGCFLVVSCRCYCLLLWLLL